MSTVTEEVSKKTNFLGSAWKMHRAKIGCAITLVVVVGRDLQKFVRAHSA